MTDKELLELAAKAAGMPIGYADGWMYLENVRGGGWGMYRGYDRVSVDRWNPLTDDGDALRLAVKIGLDIAIFDKESVNSGIWSAEHNKQWPSPVEFGNDPYAATRRAIVRAAAEIGKENKE